MALSVLKSFVSTIYIFFFFFFVSLLCTWHFGWLGWAFHSHHTYKVCLSCGLWFGFVLWGELPNSQSTFKNLSCAMFTTDILIWTLLFLTSQFSLLTCFMVTSMVQCYCLASQEGAPSQVLLASWKPGNLKYI